MRPSRLWAVARRDLAVELGGRRGWVLPAVAALLLGPAAAIRLPGNVGQPPRPIGSVAGDVPAEVLALPTVRQVPPEHAIMVFSREDDGGLRVRARQLPEEVRGALDAGAAPVAFVDVRRTLSLPGRSLLLALIASSVLTGAVSESLPGERSRKTLESMLTAAITRAELVTGKWLAWAGFGAATAGLAALAAILRGVQEPGMWLLPLPFVPACTVALGLFLVRGSADVVGGAAVSLRVLPAMLSVLGVCAWLLGEIDPRLGATLPLGGALVAAGGAWDGPMPALAACASTGAFTAGLLAMTTRALRRETGDGGADGRVAVAAIGALVAAAAWWVPLLGPLLWAAAGNAGLTEDLPARSGLLAGAALLLLAAVVRGARADDLRAELGLTWPSRPTIALTLGAAALLSLSPPLLSLGLPIDGLWAAARERMAFGLHPTEAGAAAAIATIVAQELVWRGFLLRAAGPWVATALWVAVHAPLDPAYGLVSGAILALLVGRSGGSVLPAIQARLVATAIWAI